MAALFMTLLEETLMPFCKLDRLVLIPSELK